MRTFKHNTNDKSFPKKNIFFSFFNLKVCRIFALENNTTNTTNAEQTIPHQSLKVSTQAICDYNL